jgi:hypothetical protein
VRHDNATTADQGRFNRFPIPADQCPVAFPVAMGETSDLKRPTLHQFSLLADFLGFSEASNMRSDS